MDDLKDGATITREPSPQKVVETDQYRLAAVESGRQPSYGKRLQLIPDGLNSPSLHMEAGAIPETRARQNYRLTEIWTRYTGETKVEDFGLVEE